MAEQQTTTEARSRQKARVNACYCFVSQHWYDYYLQWNQSEYPGVKNLRFTPDQVWTPDILLYNRCVILIRRDAPIPVLGICTDTGVEY